MTHRNKQPKTIEQAWKNYQRNRAWFILRCKPIPPIYQLTKEEHYLKYSGQYEQRGKEKP